jgi:PAS domain S-box-containing protein
MVLILIEILQRLTNCTNKLSLQTVLIVPFILQIFAVVGLTGYLSFKNGQKAVNDVAAQLRTEISKRVEQNLQTYFDTLHQINQSTAAAISINELDVQDFAKLQRHFFEQLRIFKSPTLVGFANTNREFISAERLSDGSLTIRVSGKSTGYELRTYTTNSQGERIKVINVGKNYNPERRSWYKTPIQRGKQSWSEIYPHITGATLYLGASQPIYDKKGKLEGVLLSNLNLLEIGNFLLSLKIGKTGESFIIERSGMLVATSTNEKPFQFIKGTVTLPENKVTRLLAKDISNRIIQGTAKYLETRFGNFNSIKSEQQLDFKINGKKQFIQVLPFQDNRGIDWLIVVVIPEDDFMEQINANTHITILLCIAALIVATVVGVLIVRWIVQPVLALSKSATALAEGEWDRRLEIRRSDELGELAKSFNSMAHQIQATFLGMQTLNKALLQSESRQKQFLEAVPVGVSIHDTTGQLYYANRAAQELLDIEILPEVKTEELAEFYHVYLAESDQLYPTAELPIVRSLAGETVEVENVELRQGNKIIPLQVFSTPIFDDLGNVAYAIAAFFDITERKKAQKLLADYNSILEQQVAERTLELEKEILERKQAEVALQESEARFRLLAEATFEAITINEQGIIFDNNPTCSEMFGYEVSEVIGKPVMDFIAPEYREQVMENIRSGYEGVYETVCLRKDGTTFPAEARARVMSYRGRTIRIAAIQDITYRKQAEQAIVLAERNRLAQEIHDTLAQAFAVVIVHLDTASRKLATADIEAAQKLIKAARDLAHSGLSEARRSVKALRPQLLENSDLCSAFNCFATQMFSHTSTHVVCQVVGEMYPLPSNVENNLLRIGQEALTNAFKYAKAGEIQIELVYEQKQCILRIKDDGQGFEISSVSDVNSFGLLGIKERVEHIGGQLTIQSKPGQGTEVVVTVKIGHGA